MCRLQAPHVQMDGLSQQCWEIELPGQSRHAIASQPLRDRLRASCPRESMSSRLIPGPCWTPATEPGNNWFCDSPSQQLSV